MKPQHDIMGQAGMDFLENADPSAVIKVWSDIAETDDIPVSYFFRSYEEMPLLEQQALSLVRGKVLDVGAGMGSHSLHLQAKGVDVTALEISPMACDVMKKRGVKNVLNDNFYNLSGAHKYDTILFLMNGMGVAQNLEGFPRFFNQLRKIIAPGGQILMDSSDLRYLFTEEDGSMIIDLNSNYYGEIIYRMSYRHFRGEKFPWLFIDEGLMDLYAQENGFIFEKLLDGSHFDYMGRLEVKTL